VSAGPVRLAVVDVGSNSVRLLLCDGVAADGPRGERLTTVTALRRGASGDGAIAADALSRLDDCLAGYSRRIAAFAADRVVAVGTSAVRDAPNRSEVAAVVERRLQTSLTVLSGDEEARCAFAGARLGAPGDGDIMVVDIGGASTELVRGGPDGPVAAVSLQLGAVRQAERHLHGDPPAPAEAGALRAEALGMVAEGIDRIGGPAPAVGVAGTVTSLAAIELGVYDRDRVHGHRLARATVERLAGELCALTIEARRALPGLEPARAEVIPAGALIAAAVLEAADLDGLTVSERDLLDGLVLQAVSPSSDLFRS
jgi:exopolyphosphatase/guanosine-5'-triphosphate,3'-diphosphate pyrophosphatase